MVRCGEGSWFVFGMWLVYRRGDGLRRIYVVKLVTERILFSGLIGG